MLGIASAAAGVPSIISGSSDWVIPLAPSVPTEGRAVLLFVDLLGLAPAKAAADLIWLGPFAASTTTAGDADRPDEDGALSPRCGRTCFRPGPDVLHQSADVGKFPPFGLVIVRLPPRPLLPEEAGSQID